MTLILTYHAIEDGPAPLCIEPGLFSQHVAAIADSGANVLTVTQLARALRTGTLPERAVAITFDDGCASVVDQAAPILREHGIAATVFCVAGHLGGYNDWPTQPASARRLRLASVDGLRALATDGWEIGSHGYDHAPLSTDDADVRREVVDSRPLLEELLEASVTSFAWPYAVQPSPAALSAAVETYEAACGGGLAFVTARSDPFTLPRVDAHYLRNPAVLLRALSGSASGYLALRRSAARLRRALRKDYARGEAR